MDTLARHRWASLLLVFGLSFMGSWAYGSWKGVPVPYVHDEFSYLLAGDTFAHGRLTNPAHPLWEYFESFNIIQQPTYMSKYPPGQGLFLALGQRLFGRPIAGVWLSAGLMCAAICWMLYAWVPPRWALTGGLICVLQFGIFTYWSQGYWGGCVAALGGALMLGALPRILKMSRWIDALWLGLGCAILANSRPLEGFLVAVPVAALALPWKIKAHPFASFQKGLRIVLPLGMILGMTALGMGAYNERITQERNLFPYFVYQRAYENLPLLIWQSMDKKVEYRHKIMELQEKNFLEKYFYAKKTWPGFWQSMKQDAWVLSMFYFGYPLAIPALGFLLMLFGRPAARTRLLAALAVVLTALALMRCRATPHYFSPLTGIVSLVLVMGLRTLGAVSWRRVRIGLILVLFLCAFQLLLNMYLTPHVPAVKSLARARQSAAWALPAVFTRDELERSLREKGGKYLVVVHYPLAHNYFYDWVYNEAVIDQAPIVWARGADNGNDQPLLDYFKDRRALPIDVVWDRRGIPCFWCRQ